MKILRGGLLSIKKEMVVILAYMLITVVVTYPLMFNLTDTIPHGIDSDLVTWIMSWDIHSFTNDIGNIFNTNTFFPNENTLTYSEHFIGEALLAWPIVALTGNITFAYNCILLLFFVLGAYCMYRFMYYMTKSRIIAFFAGVIFGFNPYKFIHIHQMHLQVIFFFPLLLLLLNKIVEQRKIKYFVWFTVIFVCLGMVMLTGLFLLIYFLIIKKTVPSRHFIYSLVLSILTIVLLVAPVFLPYMRMVNEPGIARSMEEINHYSPAIADYLSFSPVIRTYFERPGTMEADLYSGFFLVILFIFSIYYIFKNRIEDKSRIKTVIMYTIILVIITLISFGITIRLTYNSQGFVGPYYFMYQLIPGFDNLRALGGRLFIVNILVIAVIIGLAMKSWKPKTKNKAMSMKVIVSLFSFLVLLEYILVPPHWPIPYKQVRTDSEVPEIYDWIKSNSDINALLELPIDASYAKQMEYIYNSKYHWKNMWNGYSGFYPTSYINLEEEIANSFETDRTLKKLFEIGINYVLIHFDVESPFTDRVTPEQLAESDHLQFIQNFDSDYIYKLK
jgi:hypothetical protein